MCDDDPLTSATDGEFAGWADRLASHLSEIAQRRGARLRLRQPRRAGPQARRRRRPAARGRPVAAARPRQHRRRRQRHPAPQGRPRRPGIPARGCRAAHPGDRAPTCSWRPPSTLRTLRWSRRPGVGRAIHAANIWSIARRNGAHVIDQWGLHALRDWRMWADDRIHMTTEGHRRVALAALRGAGPRSGRDRLGDAARAGTADRPPGGAAGQRPVGQGVRRPLGSPPPHRTVVRRHRQAKRPEIGPLD